MLNVLQTHPYIIFTQPKTEVFQMGMSHILGFFWGHMSKNESRCLCTNNTDIGFMYNYNTMQTSRSVDFKIDKTW